MFDGFDWHAFQKLSPKEKADAFRESCEVLALKIEHGEIMWDGTEFERCFVDTPNADYGSPQSRPSLHFKHSFLFMDAVRRKGAA